MEDRDANSICHNLATEESEYRSFNLVKSHRSGLPDPDGIKDAEKKGKELTTPLSNLPQTPLEFLTPTRLSPTFHNISNPSPLDSFNFSFLNSFLCFSF